MTKRQVEALKRCVDGLDAMEGGGDPECLHGEAEDLLCNLLKDIGLHSAADAFDRAGARVGFWYA